MKERLTQLRAFLNPLNRAGVVVGRVAAPLIVAAAITSQAVPQSPIDLAGVFTPGVDVSVYGGQIDESRWQQIGQRVAVVGSWHGLSGNPYAEGNLAAAHNAGYAIASYIALSPSYGGAQQVDWGKHYVGSKWNSLIFVAIDVEIDGVTVGQIQEAMARVRELGQYPVIYTARWFWDGYMSGTCALAGEELWNAHYDYDPDVDYNGYGCFVLMGEQYQGTTDLFGVSVDLNVFDDEFIADRLLALNPQPSPISVSPPVDLTYGGPPLIKLATDPEVFVVVGEVNRYRLSLCSLERFVGEGYRWEDIRVVVESDPLWRLPSWKCN